MQQVIVLFGSNLGDRIAFLRNALVRLEHLLGPASMASSVYETAPWGITDQPGFLNAVVLFQSTLPAEVLLDMLLTVENELGRKREVHWGPRTIDLDLLFVGQQIIQSPRLTLPHPEIQSRRFTLVPLCELVPTLIHPVLNTTLSQLLQQCPDNGIVTLSDQHL